MFLARCRFGIPNTKGEAPRNDLPTALPQFIGLPGPLKNNNYDGDNCYLCRRSKVSPMSPLARTGGARPQLVIEETRTANKFRCQGGRMKLIIQIPCYN